MDPKWIPLASPTDFKGWRTPKCGWPADEARKSPTPEPEKEPKSSPDELSDYESDWYLPDHVREENKKKRKTGIRTSETYLDWLKENTRRPLLVDE